MCAIPEAQRNRRHARLKLRADLKPRTKPAITRDGVTRKPDTMREPERCATRPDREG